MIYTILVGLIAGFAAGKIMKGKGFGFIVNILLGLGGAFVAKFIFEKAEFDLGQGLLPEIFQAMIGAILILAIANLLGANRR